VINVNNLFNYDAIKNFIFLHWSQCHIFIVINNYLNVLVKIQLKYWIIKLLKKKAISSTNADEWENFLNIYNFYSLIINFGCL